MVAPVTTTFLSAAASAGAAVLAIWKGGAMLTSAFAAIRKLIAIILFFITLAEDTYGEGTGPQKKAKVIADVQRQLPDLGADLNLPSGLVALFTSDTFLGIVIDALVAAANQLGSLAKPAEEPAPQAPAGG